LTKTEEAHTNTGGGRKAGAEAGVGIARIVARAALSVDLQAVVTMMTTTTTALDRVRVVNWPGVR
jgi:hypothetical protein